jgi:23S rRNA pseudouridine1911/1915/1917 synthase
MKEIRKLIVDDEKAGERLDAFISEQINNLSRSMVKSLINDSKVMVGGEGKKPSYHVQEGDEIIISIPEPQAVAIIAQDINLEIIYQDKDIAIINKPKGMVVHPAHGNWDHTLVNALLYHIKDLSGLNGELRPGIVHRLDKDTSGIMIVAKNDTAHRDLAEQIQEHSINREYTAMVHGIIKENAGTIEAPIGRSKIDRKKMAVTANGKPAISNYRVIKRFNDYTLVNVKLFTGRTHQIRVHFAYIKHSVVGDPLYGSKNDNLGLESQVLHAHLLGFIHPATREYMEFRSPLPDYIQKIIAQLN